MNITTFGVLATIDSLQRPMLVDRVQGAYQSILFTVLARIASLSRLCREEQMPECRSTYYASSNSSTSAPWQLLIPYVLAALLPSVIRTYYEWTRTYEGPVSFWIGIVFRAGLFLTAIFWTLDAADDGDWFSLNKDMLKSTKIALAQVILTITLIGGGVTLYWIKPCVRIELSDEPPAQSNGTSSPSSSQSKGKLTAADTRPLSASSSPTAVILGSNNAHGGRYFLFVAITSLGLILLQKPMGHFSLGILIWQILCLLEILSPTGTTTHSNNPSSTSSTLTTSAIGPITLGLLGNFHFFKTGHQATLSSIQWESAFIPLRQVTYPWSPLLVLCNTFAAQILCTLAVPLLVLWRRPPNDSKRGLIRGVGKAMGMYLLFHATINLATTMWTAWLRRHLMLYRIFSPRWMLGSVVLLVCDLVGVGIAVGLGVRWNTGSVGDVFGWG